VLYTGRRSRASLLFSDGSIIKVYPNSRVELSLRDTDKRQDASVAGSLSEGVLKGVRGIFSAAKERETLTAVPGIRKKIEEEEERGVRILDPRNSKILNSKPTFCWKAMGKDNIVMVSLTLKGTRGKLWTIQTEETKISYPDGRRGLDRHQTYFLRVENLADSSLYDEVYFRVLDEKKAAEVMRFAKKMEDYRKLNPDDSTAFFILVVYYMEKELYHKALVELEKLEKEYPGERFVLKKRGEIFARIGLWTKWQEVNQMLNAMK
jgi:hypothetical protein